MASVIMWGVSCETRSCFSPLPSQNIFRMSCHAGQRARRISRKNTGVPTTPKCYDLTKIPVCTSYPASGLLPANNATRSPGEQHITMALFVLCQNSIVYVYNIIYYIYIYIYIHVYVNIYIYIHTHSISIIQCNSIMDL